MFWSINTNSFGKKDSDNGGVGGVKFRESRTLYSVTKLLEIMLMSLSSLFNVEK